MTREEKNKITDDCIVKMYNTYHANMGNNKHATTIKEVGPTESLAFLMLLPIVTTAVIPIMKALNEDKKKAAEVETKPT